MTLLTKTRITGATNNPLNQKRHRVRNHHHLHITFPHVQLRPLGCWFDHKWTVFTIRLVTGFNPKSVFVSAVPVKLNINTNKVAVFVLFRSCLRFHGLHALQLYTISNLSESRTFRLFFTSWSLSWVDGNADTRRHAQKLQSDHSGQANDTKPRLQRPDPHTTFNNLQHHWRTVQILAPLASASNQYSHTLTVTGCDRREWFSPFVSSCFSRRVSHSVNVQ